MREGALFDFDGTIIYPDSTKYLVREFLKRRPLKIFVVLKSLLVIKTSQNLQQIQFTKNSLICSLIKGMSLEEVGIIISNFQKKIRKLIRPVVLNRIRELSKDDKVVLIVTASPAFALKDYFKEQNIFVIGTEFKYQEGIYSGNMNSRSCYGHEKVERINSWLRENKIKIHFTEAWSDSYSDRPMMDLSDKRYWVGKDENFSKFKDSTEVYIND